VPFSAAARSPMLENWPRARCDAVGAAGQATLRAGRFGSDSGKLIANRGVVSRSPTLPLITRKFARQSHAAVGTS
jgi:hypothetical protein